MLLRNGRRTGIPTFYDKEETKPKKPKRQTTSIKCLPRRKEAENAAHKIEEYFKSAQDTEVELLGRNDRCSDIVLTAQETQSDKDIFDQETPYGDDIFDQETQCGDDIFDQETQCGEDIFDQQTQCDEDLFDQETLCGEDIFEQESQSDDVIFNQQTKCDEGHRKLESLGNSDIIDTNRRLLCAKTGLTIFDFDTECDSDKSLEKEIVTGEKNTKLVPPNMHEARGNNMEKSNLRQKMKPYKKRLIHQQLQEKNNGDEESESDSEYNNNIPRVVSEKEEKHHRAGRRKPSRKQFRHQDIPVFKPDSVATSFLLKSKDISTAIKKPDNKDITKSIVMKLGGQLKTDSVAHARSAASFLNHTKTEASNPPSTSGMHHLPAIVPETPPVRRKSHDYSAQTKPLFKSSQQSTADMPQLNSDNNTEAAPLQKPIKCRRKTIAGPELLESDLAQNITHSIAQPQAPAHELNHQQTQPRRRFSVTDGPMDLTNANKHLLQEVNNHRNSNIGNGVTNLIPQHNKPLPESLPFQMPNEEGYNNINVYYPSRSNYPSVAPPPYYAAPKLIPSTPRFPDYTNGAQPNNNNINNNNNTQQPNFQYPNVFNATPEQCFPDESILKPSIKSLSLYMKTKFNIEVLWSLASLYQKISMLVAKDRVTYKTKQNAQKCLNEAYGYVAQKLPELNLSPSLVREALLNPNFFSLPLNEHMKNKLYPPNVCRPGNGSMQAFRTPTEENKNNFSYKSSQEYLTPRTIAETFPREVYLQSNQFNPVPTSQENIDYRKYTNNVNFDPNLLNKNTISNRNHLNQAPLLQMETSAPIIPKNYMNPADPRTVLKTPMPGHVNNNVNVSQFQEMNNHNVVQFQSQNGHNAAQFQIQKGQFQTQNGHNFPQFQTQNSQYVKRFFDPMPILPKGSPEDVQEMYRQLETQANVYSNKDNLDVHQRKTQLTLDLKPSTHSDMGLFKNHTVFKSESLQHELSVSKIVDNRNFLNVPDGLQITPCEYSKVPPQIEAVVSSSSSTELPERLLTNSDVIVGDNSMQITKEPLQDTHNTISSGIEEKINREFQNIKDAKMNKIQEDSEFKNILTELLHKYQSKIPLDKLKTLLLDQYWEMKKEDPSETIVIEDSDCDEKPNLDNQSPTKTLKRKSFDDPQKHIEKWMTTTLREEKPPTPPKKKLHSPDINENYELHANTTLRSPTVRQELIVKRLTPPTTQFSSPNKVIYSPTIEPISPVSNEKVFIFPEQPSIYTASTRASVVPIEVLKGSINSTSSTTPIDTYRKNRKNSDSDQSVTSPYGPRPLSAGKKKPPNGKLCYVRESNTFIRYFDDNQVELFMRNLNIHSENALRQPEGDHRKLSPCVASTIGRTEQVLRIPKNVVFSNKEDISDPEEYVLETELVKKNVPDDFASFYLFVTGYQIVRNNPPISFQTFLTMYNTNRLQELLDKYLGNEHRT